MSETLLEVFAVQATRPPAGDERIAAFSQSMLDVSRTVDGAQLVTAIEARKFETASYGANLLLRAMQKQLLRLDADYPLEYDEPDQWSRSITAMLGSTAARAELMDDIASKHTVSNVVERYKAFKLVTELLASWLPATPRLVDVGCSRNHGLKKLHLGLPFRPIQSGVAVSSGTVSSTVTDHLFNTLIHTPRNYGSSIGLDMSPLDSAENASWAKCCSFYPSELLDTQAVQEYDELEASEPEKVGFAQQNILADTTSLQAKFDVATVSTFLYQLPSAQRTAARLAIRQLVADGGVVMYQDFTKRDRAGQDMQYEDDWFARLYPYRTLVEAPARSGDRLYEVLRWSNGRCKQWVPGRDLEELIGKLSIV